MRVLAWRPFSTADCGKAEFFKEKGRLEKVANGTLRPSRRGLEISMTARVILRT